MHRHHATLSGRASTRSSRAENALRSILAEIKCSARHATSLQALLTLGELYGWMLHANHTHKYADDQLVRLAIRRFFPEPAVSKEAPRTGTLHVVSHTHSFGGHTRLMERLASYEPTRPSLLITQSSHADYATSREGLFADVRCVPPGRDMLQVQAIARHCGAFEQIVIHITEYDFRTSVAMLLAKRLYGTRLLFVNHADHKFSFAREFADCFLQISKLGLHSCGEHLPRIPSSFVGIPLDGEPCPIPQQTCIAPFTVLTGGASWKFRPTGGLSLVPHLRRLLLDVDDAHVVIIGANALRDRWWWPLKLRHWRRVRLVRSLPHAEYLKQLHSSSVVLDSFPISGGTAFVESLWRGAWVYALRSPLAGASPTDQLRRATLSELKPALLTRAYRDELERCQKTLPAVHSPAAVSVRFQLALEGRRIALPDSIDSQADTQFLAKAWAERGSITVPADVLRLIPRESRPQLRTLFIRSLGLLTLVSQVRAILFWAYALHASLRREST